MKSPSKRSTMMYFLLIMVSVIALSIFLLLVVLANKYICAWGCQAGTLQDLIFRINQTDRQKAVMGRQIKLPFILTNTIRFLFLGVFTLAAILKRNTCVIPDCFACYTCREVCPTESIVFSTRKRTLPPVDHFNRIKKAQGEGL